MVEVKMKRLERTPSSLPLPDPNAILCNLSWLSGFSTEVLDTIHSYAKLMQFEHGDVVIHQGDSARGIYIIVSGLVKVRDVWEVVMLLKWEPGNRAKWKGGT